MSTFTYIVTVETERDSGLIAGRDEQSDSIVEAIEQAVYGHQIDSIGARSDSTYSVTSVDIAEYDNKSLKAELAEYDAAVAAAAPSNADLLAEVKTARAEAAAAGKALERAHEKLALYEADQDRAATRIWQESRDGIVEGPRQYLADGRYDRVAFELKQEGLKHPAEVKVGFDGRRGGKEVLEIRVDGFMQIAAIPQSSNVLHLMLIDR